MLRAFGDRRDVLAEGIGGLGRVVQGQEGPVKQSGRHEYMGKLGSSK